MNSVVTVSLNEPHDDPDDHQDDDHVVDDDDDVDDQYIDVDEENRDNGAS